ncbi:copper chaperone PCu(A)C [Rhizobium sp. PAMB 3182]
MQTTTIRLLTLIVTLMTAPLAWGHEFKVGDLEIIHPNSRAMIPGAKVGGGYLKIINHGSTDDRLVAIKSDRSDNVQMHEMSVENNVMKMRELPDGIAIPAGKTVELKKGGLHVMFMDVKKPFKEGDMVKATLVFEKAGSVDVEFAVGNASGNDGGDMKGMDMKSMDGMNHDAMPKMGN